LKKKNYLNKKKMLCPVCLSEIQDYSTLCPVCGAAVEPISISEKRLPWALVYTTNTTFEAEMFKANLESAGIPTQILSQVDTTRMFTVGELAIVKIYVLSPYVADAMQIIEAIERGEE
jgi:hypothetical protein